MLDSVVPLRSNTEFCAYIDHVPNDTLLSAGDLCPLHPARAVPVDATELQPSVVSSAPPRATPVQQDVTPPHATPVEEDEPEPPRAVPVRE